MSQLPVSQLQIATLHSLAMSWLPASVANTCRMFSFRSFVYMLAVAVVVPVAVSFVVVSFCFAMSTSSFEWIPLSNRLIVLIAFSSFLVVVVVVVPVAAVAFAFIEFSFVRALARLSFAFVCTTFLCPLVPCVVMFAACSCKCCCSAPFVSLSSVAILTASGSRAVVSCSCLTSWGSHVVKLSSKFCSSRCGSNSLVRCPMLLAPSGMEGLRCCFKCVLRVLTANCRCWSIACAHQDVLSVAQLYPLLCYCL